MEFLDSKQQQQLLLLLLLLRRTLARTMRPGDVLMLMNLIPATRAPPFPSPK